MKLSLIVYNLENFSISPLYMQQLNSLDLHNDFPADWLPHKVASHFSSIDHMTLLVVSCTFRMLVLLLSD